MDKLIAKLRVIDTPTLSNAIELLKVRNRISGFCDRQIRCLTPTLGVLCGYAITAQVETMSPDGEGGLDNKFIDLCRSLDISPRPSIVVLQEYGIHPEFSAHCGEVMVTIFKRLGAIGVVSDSGVRDLKEVMALKFHIFAPGVVASHGNFRILQVGIPVTICGLNIEQGDLLHGDINGLIKVPKEGRDKLPELAGKIRCAEAALFKYVKSNNFTIKGLHHRLRH